MKMYAAIATSVLFLGTIISVAKASDRNIKIREGDTTFRITSYDDNRSKPYRIRFRGDYGVSRFLFNEDGMVRIVAVGSEKYKVKYDSDGNLTKVKLISSGRRHLLEDEEDNLQQIDQHNSFGRRRLYDCVDCYDTWDVMCGKGYESVCDLEFLDTDVLSDEALEDIDLLCDSLEILCATNTGSTACDGQCECIPALQISLEWFEVGDLDLVVTEPSGEIVKYNNPMGDYGFLDNDNVVGPDDDPENYFVTSGLSGRGMRGNYDAYVNVFSISNSVSWKLTASVYGTEVWTETGTFEPADEQSATFTVALATYIDNECTNMAFNVVENVGDKEP